MFVGWEPSCIYMHDAVATHTTSLVACQVVDVIMQTTLGEMDDAAVLQDPLIKLPCGHFLCTSTLDGG